jgi:anthranilate phosphoribosyltransferase
MIKQAINSIVQGKNLTFQEAYDVMDQIMSGEATEAQIGSFITALRMKGETPDEIAGCALVMREKATQVPTKHSLVVDTCGTGGDGSHTFNISTTAAFVVAGAGLPVAKHGNRSVSSKCGSADVLEALGINLQLTPQSVGNCIDEIGIGFLFAPSLHGAMRYAVGARREIGIRTIFNVLGPLTNPAGAQAQVIGVYDQKLTEIMAKVLHKLGTPAAFVVHGSGGLDEVSILGETKVTRLKDDKIDTFILDPVEYGFKYGNLEDLVGGTAEDNAVIVQSILEGKKGVNRDIVILNAALALLAGEKGNTLEEAIKLAEESIDSGAAYQKLNQLRTLTKAVQLS